MRILHIVPTYLPAYRYGGPIESVHALNVELVRQGAEVTVYTTNIDGSNDLDVPLGKPVMVDGVKVFYFRSSFPRAWFYSRDMRNALRAHMGEFDIVHITSVFLAASTLGAYYARKFRKPYVISPRGNLMRSPLGSRWLKKYLYNALIEKGNLRHAAAIHFTVPAEREDYERVGFPLRRAIVLPNGIDPHKYDHEYTPGSFREKHRIGKEKKLAVFLGRLNWMKGFDTLIPAFAMVAERDPDAMLAIVGGDEGGYKKNIESLISDYRLQHKVIFAGMLRGAEKSAALHDGDFFVLPSYSENFGMAALEAMHAGLPLVVTEGVGVSKDIRDAGAGIVVRKDARELAEAMFVMLHDPHRGLEMGRCGKELVKRKFYEDKIAERFLGEYNKLIADSRI